MKKIVHIVESFGGGVYSYLLDLTSELCSKYEVYILYGLRDQTPENFKEQFDSRIHFVRIDDFTRGLNPIKDFKAFLEIKCALKSIKPNVIHLHSSKAGGIGRIIKYDKKSLVFYTPHGYSFLDNKLKSKIYFIIEKILGRRNVCTVACSKGEYLESLKVTKNAIYINNSIDTNYLKKFYIQTSNSKNIIFTIGRISEQKNPKLFNEIAKEMKDFKFIWIGDGPLRNELSAKNIIVTGWLNRDKVLKMIQPYKFFLLTSKWEGLPISLLEAMYFSKTCFVTNVIGNRNVIESDITGYTFNDKRDFFLKFNERSYLGNKPKEYVEQSFSKDKMIKQYLKLYEN